MKVKRGIAIALLCTSLVFSLGVKAEEPAQYNLKSLQERLINESPDVKVIDINTKLLDVKYAQSIKDYNDLKDTADRQEDTLRSKESYLSTAKEQYRAARNVGEAAAASSSAEHYLGAYNQEQQRLRNIVKSLANSEKTLEPVMLQQKQAQQLKANQIGNAKYAIQTDYYNLYVMNKQLELAKGDYENTLKLLDTEKLKANYGMTTRINIEDLESKKRTLESSINDLNNNIELATENMKTKLNIQVENNLDIKYLLPDIEDTKSYNLVVLLSNFRANNTDLQSQQLNTRIYKDISEKISIAYSVDYDLFLTPKPLNDEDRALVTSSNLDYQKAQIDEQTVNRNMESNVKKVYFQYKKAVLDLNSAKENKKLLEQKKIVAEANYNQGQISKLQYDLQIQDLNRSLLDVDKAVIAFENAKVLIDMVNQGIYVK